MGYYTTECEIFSLIIIMKKKTHSNISPYRMTEKKKLEIKYH
jgi:hypothetical protein